MSQEHSPGAAARAHSQTQLGEGRNLVVVDTPFRRVKQTDSVQERAVLAMVEGSVLGRNTAQESRVVARRRLLDLLTLPLE